ncbi:hypothetical protein FA13DRAFT_1090788 [Coprinellus micaceus]|uniref:Uncharacterized protein n=1 Tax=Coprinellus micaceus TaxID=71717 RepID=A0A4Y7TTM1_COPMI|nr:hypothetical protein FA13DRAFT_1090788 [Coprinellus micaceus]
MQLCTPVGKDQNSDHLSTAPPTLPRLLHSIGSKAQHRASPLDAGSGWKQFARPSGRRPAPSAHTPILCWSESPRFLPVPPSIEPPQARSTTWSSCPVCFAYPLRPRSHPCFPALGTIRSSAQTTTRSSASSFAHFGGTSLQHPLSLA